MAAYKVAYFVGSLSSTSINRKLSQALINLAPDDLEFTEVPIDNLPLYSPDHDNSYPPEAQALKDALGVSKADLYGRGDCASDAQASCFDMNRSTIASAVSTPPFPFQNRPTFQQVVELTQKLPR